MCNLRMAFDGHLSPLSTCMGRRGEVVQVDRTLYSGTFTEIAQTMATYVKVKLRERILKLRPTTLIVPNLAMIFKLEVDRGIYIRSEEQGEINLPSDSGRFVVDDFAKTYVVHESQF